MKWVFIIVLGVCLAGKLEAQYYTSGEAPFSVEWKQINTDQFKIIFPSNFETQAQRFANKYAYAYPHLGYSLKYTKTKKVTIVLYNTPAFANGLTAWAPSRIEMYTTPPTDSYGQDWMEQLMVHETRHFVQMDKLNTGLTRVLSYLWGEQGTAAVVGIFLPPWYLEGDAVSTETLLTAAGRGRNPNFEQEVRALTLTKGKQKYDRALLGSYKYYMPNHYDWGYQMVTANRYLSGNNVFESTLHGIGSNLGFGAPSLHNRGTLGYYDRAFNFLQQKWTEQDAQLTPSSFTSLVSKPKVYADYTQLTSDGSSIYASKSTMNDAPQFIVLDSLQQEKKFLQRGYRASGRFSVAPNGTVAWEESQPDPRYALRSYSVIKIYNPNTRNIHTLSTKSRWFSPAIASAGDRVLLVQVDLQDRYSLKIIDAANSKELWSYSDANNAYFQHPFWMADGKHVGVILNNNQGQSLVQVDLDSKEVQTLVPFTHHVLSNAIGDANNVYFTGSWSGIDNIYRYDLRSKQLFQVTEARFGASYPVPLDSQLYYANYTSQGYQLVKTTSEGINRPLSQIKNIALNLQDSILKQENTVLDFDNPHNVGDSVYLAKTYSKWNLFRFHSWGLASVNMDNINGIQPGVSLLSQNTLGTSLLTLGYNATQSQSDSKYYMQYSYRGLWPIFDVRVQAGDAAVLNNGSSFRVNEWNAQATMTLPFTFSRGNWSRKLEAYSTLSRYWVSGNNYSMMEYGARIYNLQAMGARQLQPRWGQQLHLVYSQEITNSIAIFGLESRFFFPGLAPSHGVKLGLSYQQRNQVYYKSNGVISGYMTLGNIITMPRGYAVFPAGDMEYASLNYNLPLCYPDWSLGSWMYLKRISANNFADVSFFKHLPVSSNPSSLWMNSYGTELLGEFNFLRYEQVFKLGTRVDWRSLDRKVTAEFLFAVQF